jgi:hypothetical protein
MSTETTLHRHKSLTLMDALLQKTLLIASHVGKSNIFWSTSSSSSKFFSSPSPFRVLRFILSGDKFLVNLKDNICYTYFSVGYYTPKSSLQINTAQNHCDRLHLNSSAMSFTIVLVSHIRNIVLLHKA